MRRGHWFTLEELVGGFGQFDFDAFGAIAFLFSFVLVGRSLL